MTTEEQLADLKDRIERLAALRILREIVFKIEYEGAGALSQTDIDHLQFTIADALATPDSTEAKDVEPPLPRFHVEEYAHRVKAADGSESWDDGFKVCDREDGRCWPVSSGADSLAQHMNELANSEGENDE